VRPRGPGSALAPGLEVVEHLRRGQDLDVYDCWDEARWCRVVVKAPRPGVARTMPGARLTGLAHPGIVRMLELREDDPGRPLLVLETLGGQTVGALVDERRLTVAEAAVLGRQLCGALHHLHGAGLLHLDVKPSNVVAEHGQAKLLDLSIARPPGPGLEGLGTWCYGAPEQVRGDDVTAACDVWGLALLLHEGLTGESAFDVEGERAPFPQLERRAPRARELRPRLPRRLDDLLAAGLDPDPAARPSLPELFAALGEL
jgi:eukaryotic-like serine/threonine-protein kinase